MDTFVHILSSRINDKNDERELIGFKACKVDGEEIKEDTYYTLKDGKFVEVAPN